MNRTRYMATNHGVAAPVTDVCGHVRLVEATVCNT